jgi:putative sterol carrier protein
VTEPVAEFFDGLAEGQEPLLATTTGTLRFDLEHGEGTDHWLVAVERGDLRVSRRNAKADCVVQMDRSLFGGIVAGRVNPMAAMLRGVVAARGDITLLVRFQRLFPGPPRSRAEAGAGSERRGS